MTCPSAFCESKVKAHQCECVNNFNHDTMSNEQTPPVSESQYWKEYDEHLKKQTRLTAEEIDISTVEGFMLKAAINYMSTEDAFQGKSTLVLLSDLIRRGVLKGWVKPEKTTAQLRQELEQKTNTLIYERKVLSDFKEQLTEHTQELELVKAQRDEAVKWAKYFKPWSGTWPESVEADFKEFLSSLDK